MRIADNIKRFRELKNLSREYVALQLDMSASGYSKIERGEVELTVSKIERIAKVLDVDIGLLFRFSVADVFGDGDKPVRRKVVHPDLVYMQRYIGMLEGEIERLRGKPGKK